MRKTFLTSFQAVLAFRVLFSARTANPAQPGHCESQCSAKFVGIATKNYGGNVISETLIEYL